MQSRPSGRPPLVRNRREEAFLKSICPGMEAIEGILAHLALKDVPILVFGEAGAGKLAFARRIHELSRHSGREFRIVTSKDLGPPDFERNDGNVLSCKGTVYLAEISHLTATAQASLMKMLLEIDKSGDEKFHGRLVCGATTNLEAEARSGQFHEGLYCRISGISLHLPPLRYRRQDIPLLMDFFLAKFAQEFGKPRPALSQRTQQLISDHDWPGNVRELADAAKAFVVLGDEALAMGGLRAMLAKTDRDPHGQQISLREATRAASRETEKELIMKALTRTRWNRRRAAAELKISYKALLYKLKQIGYSQSEAS